MKNNIETQMFIPEKLNLMEVNTVLITLDSCRFDSMSDARMPFMKSHFGPPLKAHTLSTYTPASHTSMWLGHLPTMRTGNIPYCHEPTRQLWRLVTGPARDAGKGCGILFQGNNVIEGFRKMGFHAQGIGGVSQFSKGSFLRGNFPWSDFRYFGPDMDEEPLAERKPVSFPLNHVKEIVNRVGKSDKFFLFINSPETHYPYDWGEGIGDHILNQAFPLLKQSLNLRSLTAPTQVTDDLHQFSKDLHEMQVNGLEAMDPKLAELFTSLRGISKRPVAVVIVGDHGENFGEVIAGKRLFGHMHPSSQCVQVPMWMGVL